MGFLNFRISLRLKIIAIGVLGLLGLAFVGGIYLVGAQNQAHYQKTADDASAISKIASNAHDGILRARDYEKEFLLYGDQTRVQEHMEAMKATSDSLDQLTRRFDAMDQAELADKARALRSEIDDYTTQFAGLVAARRKLGLNQDLGLQNALRATARAIESEIEQFGDLKLHAAIHAVRHFETAFMLRRDGMLIEDFKKSVAAFATSLAEANMPDAKKTDVAEKLAAYERDFFEWVKAADVVDTEATLTSVTYGLIAPDVEAIETASDRLYTTAMAANAASREETKNEIEIATLIAIFGVGLLSFVLGRSVARPLSAMTGAMGRLAEGDFEVALPGLGRRDEIGDMAGAVERFKVVAVEKARRELRAAAREAHLQSILATIPDAMIIIDEKGNVHSFSSAAERLFGYTAAEMIGRNVNLLMPSPYNEMHDFYITRYLQTGEQKVIGVGRVAVGERKDGSTFPIELAVGEMNSDGQRFFTGFIRDLTERQKTEARLQELQSELVHISRLTAMGEIASALAHELNQPLSAIANYMTGSRRLLANNSDEQSIMVREAVDKAADQALRAGQIIRRLRDFVAHRESERRVESIKKLIEEASALALIGAKELGVRVRFRFDPAVDLVLVDKVQIQQVLLNLMRNAIEAMAPSDRRELTISVSPRQDHWAVIEVSDTGSGISPEISNQLFQPFITTKSHGMGIGLSISRTIIEGHDGKIWADPNPEGGSVFCFTLRTVSREELGAAAD